MAKKHYILGVDTSHNRGQLCLFDGSTLVENIFWEKSGSHSEVLTQQFESLLNQYQDLQSNIAKIYCVVGPGSFTGLRVGINFSKALAFVKNVPVLPVNSLFSMALQCDQIDKKIVSTIDAQRNSVFLSIFQWQNQLLQSLVENQLISINHLDSLIKEEINSCGSGLLRYQKFISNEVNSQLLHQDKIVFPDLTKTILENEKHKFITESHWKNIQPLYIRLSSAEEKLTGPKS